MLRASVQPMKQSAQLLERTAALWVLLRLIVRAGVSWKHAGQGVIWFK
jgi:hypothetical protein